VNVDGVWSNGCECADDGFGKSCGSATGFNQVVQGQSFSKLGVLPLAGGENWFSVTFNGSTDPSYHPQISIAATGGDDIRFDVQSGSSCSAGALNCAVEGNAAATNRTNWEIVWSNGDPNATFGVGCGDTSRVCNSCNCTASGYNGMPQAGYFGTVFIRVHRVTGAPTCHSYTLTVKD
jgi:hypothetical protein